MLFALPLKNAAAQDDSQIPNEFIFQVVMPPNWLISEAIFAYEHNGKYYLPLKELAAGFDFYVDMETDRELAGGFAASTAHSFTIDQQRNELIINAQRENLADDSILRSDYLATDDLYIQIEILNKIWPVDMRIELSALKIIVEPQEELPFVTKKKREERQDKISTRKTLMEETKKTLPRRENPYKILGNPVIDYQAIYRFDDEKKKLTGSNIFTGVQQIGKLLAEFSTNFRLEDNEGEEKKIVRPENVRLKLSRKSAGQDFLVPGIRSFEAGDVNLRQRDLIANTESGRGITISNDNRDRFNEFDRITVEGTGPPGWEIELYNNEELINFGIVPDNGQFFFEDVVLNFGNNLIKILLFGPQGQVREETRSHVAGGNMLSPGTLLYKAGLLDADREFILLDNEPRSEPRGVIKTGDVSYGVNRWLTVFGNYAELPETDKDHSYLTAGAVLSTPVGLVEAEAYKEITGGTAFNLDYITSFLGIRTNLGAAIFNNFESQDSGFGTSQKTFETSAQFNKSTRLFTLPLGLRLNTQHTERKSGLPVTTIDTAQTLSRGGLRLAHSTTTRLNDYAHETSSGGFTTTMREGPWQLRGSFNYSLYPESILNSANSEVRYKTEDGFQAALSLGHNFETSDYNAGLQLGYDFEKILGTVESNYERDAGWEFVLRATTSFNPYGPSGEYGFSSTQKRNDSPIKATVFLDKNLDGEFNDGDEPLENVRLKVGHGRSKLRTNVEGLLVTSTPPDRITNISVDEASLEDPYFIPGSEGFSTVPARGSVIEASFPIIETGAAEGTVYREDNNRIVPGLLLELFDENGEKIAESTTAFDGYYTFEFIKPGTYTARASSAHNVRLLENRFSITPAELFIYGNNLYVEILTLAQNTQGPEMQAFGPFLEQIETAAGTSETIENIALKQDIYGPFKPQTPQTEQQVPDITINGARVHAVRFKPHNDKARLVLEMTRGASYTLIPGDDPNKIEIHISEALWGLEKTRQIENQDKFYTYTATQRDDGTLLTIVSDQKIQLLRNISLGGDKGEAQRLLFDMN